MADHWTRHYADVVDPRPYGDSWTYRAGADWLADCDRVEDWGCGLGWMRQFLPEWRLYTGVDGSPSPFADVVVDLTTYTSETPGLYMRHVLEHNNGWAFILQNALDSFTERMALVIFTPFVEGDAAVQLRWEADYDVPTLSLPGNVVLGMVEPFLHHSQQAASPLTYYGDEIVFFLEKS